ncbi:hypothetical protein GINT2_000899 [Glugoides intestinalis]
MKHIKRGTSIKNYLDQRGMAQRLVLKNRSKDADDHKETPNMICDPIKRTTKRKCVSRNNSPKEASNMIRDPRQRITKRKCVSRNNSPKKTIPTKIKTKEAMPMTSRAERKFLRSAAFK